MTLDLVNARTIHVLGASGPGMGAIARILARMGHRVSACDVRDTQELRGLTTDGVAVAGVNDVVHVRGVEAMTYSSVIPESHPEIVEAKAHGVQTLVRADMLAAICATRRSIGVAGTHGKTTTSAMLATILSNAGRDPSYVIGAEVPALGTNAHWGSGDYLVVEADESDSTHLCLPLFGAIVTNIDLDHLDNFGSFDGIVASFAAFLEGISGPRVVCAHDPACADFARQYNCVTYGIDCGDVQAKNLVSTAAGSIFDLCIDGATERVELSQRGRHNVLNALAALTMATRLGVSAVDAVDALRRFGGVARRFELRGEHDGVQFIDDYAHLPAEIAASLSAARLGDARRVVAVFQPNRYHRIAQMADSYADCFVDADLVVIADIYASGTSPIEGVTGHLIVDAVRNAHPEARVEWCATRDELATFVGGLLQPGDVCLSMGCGDVATLPDEIVALRRATS